MARRKSEPTGAPPETPEAEAVVPPADDSPLPPDAGSPPAFPLDPAVAAPSRPDPEPIPEPVSEPLPEPLLVTEELHDPAVQDEEEAGWSFAARALAVLLLLLAGAGFGIWAAPRLAPMLPAGLAPVSNWLAPAADDAEARIAALESRLDSELAATGARIADLPAAADLEARISAAVAEAEARSAAEVAALRETVGQLNAGDTRQRLEQLSSTLQGQDAELASLKEQLTGVDAARSSLTEETVDRIDTYRAELDGMRAQVATLTGQVSALTDRIDEVAATADRSIETAQARVAAVEAQTSTALDAAHAASDVALMRAALVAGQPFPEVADRLAANPDVTLPAGLLAAAGGAPTLATLRASFPEAAHDAIRASILAGAGEGILARGRAFLGAQVASRSLTPQPGMTPDAVLSRMEDRLRQGDLAGVLAESASLPSEASGAMASWLAGARLRLDAEAGLAELSARLPATN